MTTPYQNEWNQLFTGDARMSSRPWTRNLLRGLLKPPLMPYRVFGTDDLRVPPKAIGQVLAELYSLVDVVEWFDFGQVSVDLIESQYPIVQEMFDNGLFNMPYPNCVFRVRIPGVDNTLLERLLFIAKVDEPADYRIFVFDLIEVGKQHDLCLQLVDLIGFDGAKEGVIFKTGTNSQQSINLWLLGALWMMLNTQGVPKTVERRDKHEDRKREIKQLPPLGNTTHVGARMYESALRETNEMARTGTHASPRPHLRRGHIRTYADGKKIWVHATIVNGTEQTKMLARDKYKVKTDAHNS